MSVSRAKRSPYTVLAHCFFTKCLSDIYIFFIEYLVRTFPKFWTAGLNKQCGTFGSSKILNLINTIGQTVKCNSILQVSVTDSGTNLQQREREREKMCVLECMKWYTVVRLSWNPDLDLVIRITMCGFHSYIATRMPFLSFNLFLFDLILCNSTCRAASCTRTCNKENSDSNIIFLFFFFFFFYFYFTHALIPVISGKSWAWFWDGLL